MIAEPAVGKLSVVVTGICQLLLVISTKPAETYRAASKHANPNPNVH